VSVVRECVRTMIDARDLAAFGFLFVLAGFLIGVGGPVDGVFPWYPWSVLAVLPGLMLLSWAMVLDG